jgi:hypothetical protein
METTTEHATIGGVMVSRAWRIEGYVHVALSVRIDDYEVPRCDLEMLHPDNCDWWYIADIEELATLLAPWGGTHG